MRARWVGSLALLLLGTGATGAQDAARARLLAEARQEGAVSFFTGTARYPAATAARIGAAFEAAYGFPVAFSFAATGPHPTVVQQIRAEAESGVAPSVDMFPTALSLVQALRQAGAVAPVDWKALGVPAGIVSRDGDALLLATIARTVTYNTSLVAADAAPRALADLGDPKWQGRIVAPAIGDAFALMVPVLGEAATLDLVRTLLERQKLSLVQTITDVGSKVASGEYAIGFGVPADFTGQQAKGAPIANAPLRQVSGQPFYAVVLTKAPHPAAATLMTAFLCCTPMGQEAMSKAIGWGNFDTPGTEANAIGGGGRGLLPSEQWQIDEQARVSREIAKLLGQ